MIAVVVHGRFSSAVSSPSAAVTALIRMSVPSAGREYDPGRRVWVIFGSRVPKLLTALAAAGVEVVEQYVGGDAA